ncbi:hypothetical protein WJX72_012327 [[Myrmecia] bisecta]|uniref:Peroxisome biogenesis protein 12 n=1 Tax=[Myrmecia] bisecta TaxID=41462 RepID=A0AAW1PAY6_9CHLO
MSFVSLGGDGSTRPTFFELVAAERMLPSLKAATIYSLSVFAQRRPFLHKLLDREDEVFAAISWALDRSSLATGSGTFAESLYGMRRAALRGSSSSTTRPTLSRTQQHATLLLLVAVPYIKAKLDRLYNQYRRQSEGPLGLTLRMQQQPEQQVPEGRSALAAGGRRLLLSIFLRVYPWAHAAQEGLRFAYQLLYLLDSTPYYSPLLHLLGQQVVRVSGQELVEAERQKQRQRRQQLQGIRQSSGPLIRWVKKAWTRSSFLFADHTRNALILSVFAFKLLEWWYTSAEEKLASNKALPPPPPPRAPLPVPGGCALPEDPSICPICRQKRTNPAMVVVSGYAFCYPCIFRYVSQHARCPVTHFPAGEEHIRRLYQSA